MDAIDILLDDHRKLVRVMDQLEKVADQNHPQRDILFQEFKKVFGLHDSAEDKYVYPLLMENLELKRMVLKGYQAHHMAEVGILELKLVPYASENWGPRFSVVRDSILTHMQDEEKDLFPRAKQLIAAERLEAAARDIEKQRM